jgi:hypothetical protein
MHCFSADFKLYFLCYDKPVLGPLMITEDVKMSQKMEGIKHVMNCIFQSVRRITVTEKSNGL